MSEIFETDLKGLVFTVEKYGPVVVAHKTLDGVVCLTAEGEELIFRLQDVKAYVQAPGKRRSIERIVDISI